MKGYRKELGYYLLAGLMLWYCWIIIVDSINIREGIIQSVKRCMDILIPSLFAFMAASGIIVRSGLYAILSRPLGFLAKWVFAMPGELFSVFIISNVAGYPVGAKLLCDLTEKGSIDKRTASTMLCFCCNAGPAFISGTIGLAVFGDTRIGLIVLLSCIISNFMLALVMCRIRRSSASFKEQKPHISADILTESVLSAGRSLLDICLLVVFFSTVMSVLAHYGILSEMSIRLGIPYAEPILASVLEITSITQLENASFGYIPVICGICSFGGLCVLLQIIVVVKDRFSLKPFLLTRPAGAMLSMLNSLWLCRLLLPSDIQASSNHQQIFVKVNNFVPSVCLILMIFLLKIKKGVAFSKRM